ncbi:hypothetical protein [Aeromicrobium sp. PE09-221]|nr:hypothetical protein [Aeromicrobium sp. PE09-221]
MPETFDELIAARTTADVSGWDLDWLDGRAAEARPAWVYQAARRP